MKSKIIDPRLILDLQSFQSRFGAEPYSGWVKDGSAFVWTFNRLHAGTIRYGAGFELPRGVFARLKFLNEAGNMLHAASIPADGEQSVCGTFEQDGTLHTLRFEPSEEVPTQGILALPFRITLNWAADEAFSCTKAGELPAGWTGDGAAVMDLPFMACHWKDGESGFDRYAMDPVLRIGAGGFAKIPVDLKLIPGDFAFEFDALIGADTDLTAAGVRLRGLYDYTPDVWYHFRFETVSGKTLLKLNGRKIADNVPAKGFRIENRAVCSDLLIDDVKVFALEYAEDYPAEPLMPKGKHSVVGINVCSLWHNGYHFGWECIDKCNDREPVLGYYDEGLPEVADWEIKYMVEHGIDFQAFCWYAETHGGPIRHPRNEFQLRDGFKNARYSDRMKYCLIWEIQNAGRPHTLDAWKKYYVPYFIEHHFRDPRYLTLDGKIVLAIFGVWNFPSNRAFGSWKETKKAVKYLDSEVKKLGFKGVLLISSNGADASHLEGGIDANAAYNFGTEGYKVTVNKASNLQRADDCGGLYAIPTISIGFDSLPWHGKSYPMMKPQDMKKVLEWCRDEYLPKYAAKGTWQEKLYWLSTWNEYGEGTYMMPVKAKLGFRYLDVLREFFTSEKADPALNVRPTAKQQERLCNLYHRK